MKTVFNFAERLAGPLLRLSLGLVLLWIGSIHLATPQPVARLLSLSLPFLAESAFVYVLGALEVMAGILLIAGLWVRYVALLALMGQFLLKDVVLASAAITVMVRDAASHEAKRAQRPQLSSR
jgi:uncharacterized membrane protein YkgB